jgi:hypothetical protein
MRRVAIAFILVLCVTLSTNGTQFIPASLDLEIVLSSFIGGSGEDFGNKVIFDSEGNIIMVGYTQSDDLAVINAHQDTHGGGRDAFILKLDSTFNVVFLTYYGGNGHDYGQDVGLDSSNNIILAGHTRSDNLVVPNALQSSMRGDGDAYVAKFSPEGTLLYGSYIGGSSDDEWITGIELDEDDNIIIGGSTDSDDMNITAGAYQETYGGGDRDILLLSLAADGQSYNFMTYFGLDSHENCADVTLDAQNNIVFTGYTVDVGITTPGAYQETYGGGDGDAIIGKLNATGKTLIWSTMLGGNGWDFGGDVSVNSDGDIIASGYSWSDDFPLQDEIYGNAPERDDYLAKLSGDGSTLLFSTLLGGDGEDRCYGMTLLNNETVATCTLTGSSDMPTVNAWQENNSGSYDAYFALYSSDLSSLLFASYIGGQYTDHGYSVAAYNDEVFALTGYSSSNDFPTHNPVQAERGGGQDAFIVVIGIAEDVTTTPPPEQSALDILPIVMVVSIVAVVAISWVYLKKRQ